MDFWVEICKILITVVLAVFGWLIAHKLTSVRDLKNKKKRNTYQLSCLMLIENLKDLFIKPEGILKKLLQIFSFWERLLKLIW